jgi:glycosyltransferase involved in cell wall biosynthesis
MDILITHYEQRETLRNSIESLTTQLSEDDRIHVVDAGSTDGSFHILEELDYDTKINLLYRDGVSRGHGRQIAFEESDADIVVAQADLDTIFYPVLQQLKDAYKRIRSERGAGVLLVHGCFISDRSTIDSIGGWNDLQVHEDKDLWIRADDTANLYQMPVSVVQHHDNFEWESPIYRFRRLYQNYRDAIRLGIPSAALGESYRHQQSLGSWPSNAVLLSIAGRRAKNMESYDTLREEYPDPAKFNLRELTFHTLVESQVIDPEVLQIPGEFSQYQSERAYPGKTSYY